MATSGSTDFTVTASQICNFAGKQIGVLAASGEFAGREMNDAIFALNLLFKQLSGPPNNFFKGEKFWHRQSSTLTLSSKASYSVKASGDLNLYPPVHIETVLRRDTDNNDFPLKPLTRAEYDALPDKAETGTPQQYHYDYGLTQGTLYLDFIPDDTTDTLIITSLREIEDVDAVGNNLDFPKHWFRPLGWMLADELLSTYGIRDPAIIQQVKMKAGEAMQMAQNFYPETTNIYFQPGRE